MARWSWSRNTYSGMLISKILAEYSQLLFKNRAPDELETKPKTLDGHELLQYSFFYTV